MTYRRLLLTPMLLLAIAASGALLMHLFAVGLASAQDDGVAGPGPALRAAAEDLGEVAAAPASNDVEESATPDEAPVVTAESTPEEVADAAWWALRAGYLGPAILLLVFAGGAQLQRRRGYVIKRWPRLNDGRVWAVVVIMTVAAGTLIPMALANALTIKALYGALLGSLLLFVKSHLGAEPPTEPAPAGN